jgi:Mn2+/Fe2+ NRAMP family transporter
MYWISKSIHLMGRFKTRLFLFLVILGPGIITVVADNDAGDNSTYAVTGSKGFNLLWAFYILVPMAYSGALVFTAPHTLFSAGLVTIDISPFRSECVDLILKRWISQ